MLSVVLENTTASLNDKEIWSGQSILCCYEYFKKKYVYPKFNILPDSTENPCLIWRRKPVSHLMMDSRHLEGIYVDIGGPAR